MRRRILASVAAIAALGLLAPAAGADVAGPDQLPDETSENLVANHSFEERDDEGWPSHWHPMWATSVEAFWADDTRASDGSWSMRVLDESTERGYALRSDSIDVQEGEPYELALDVYVNSGTLQPSVIFLDDDGERLSLEYEHVSPTPGSWARYYVDITAPEGAAQGQVLIDTTIGGVSDGWVDNVSFRPSESDDAAGVEEPLGEPILGVTNAGAGFTQDANGRNIGLVVAGGSPSQFSAVDILTGELLTTEVVEGSTLTWAYATAPDRRVYVATSSGQVYVFDPDDLSFEQFAAQPLGETYFWDADTDEDGTVYFGTYPGGKVLSYDPASDEWQDFGQQVEDNSYVRSIAVGDGEIFAGGGTTPALTRLDIATGDATEVALPAGYSDQEFAYDVDLAQDKLLVRITPSNDILVYDLQTEEWIDTIENGVGFAASPPVTTTDSGVERVEVLIPFVGGGMIAYDLQTQERRDISMDLGGASTRGWGIQEVDLDGFPGESLVTATSSAEFHIWNPETGETSSAATDAVGTPFQIRSLATGPDGDVWVGGYASPPGVSRVDADTGEHEQLPMSGQVEGMIAHNDYLVIGTYPGARLRTYDTGEAWDFGANPDDGVAIGHGQDRPVGYASSGEEVVVGSVPDYGQLGGGLSILSPDTGDFEVIDEPIEDQSVLNLAYRDGMFYGGTGIWGGLGVDPTTSEGRLFTVDPQSHEVIDYGVPVPGEQNISGLTFDDEGYLWGMTANTIFQVDVATMEVVRSQRYFNTDDSAAYWTTRDLFWNAGTLVGVTAGRLFELDPETWRLTTLQTGLQNLAIDRNGSYYYNRGGSLYRWVPDDGGGTPGTPVQQVQVIQTDLAAYIEAGDIAGPVAHQLSNALDQAVNHLEGGRPDPAAQALERVTQHLENPKEPDTVSEQAQTDLLAQVRSVLDQVG
ncbi:FIMAH domain-containing protein [Pseudactinotalea sp. Z1739]|uniref:FIMAH domain-containing protein n=1 Tax=Pseudactinotalea sp. Z1739 TaxID=3413028 RepID=UPI003C7C447B